MSNTIATTNASKMPPGARFILMAFGLGLAAVVVNSAISYRNLAQLAENYRLEIHTQAVLVEIEAAFSMLKDAETGQRGYLLTGNGEYLEPFNSASGHVNSNLQRLRKLTVDNPNQQQRLDVLEPKVLAKLNELRSTIQLYKNQNPSAALAMVKTGLGKTEMDEIREIMRQMEQEERDLLERRRDQSQRSVRQSFVTLSLAAIALMTLLLGTALGAWQHVKFRQKSEERIRGERKWLQVTLASIGDAVLATDNIGRVVFMNKMAEELTGWTEPVAQGKPLDEVFCIFNEQTREKVESPVAKALREGAVVGLANHTVLRARNGSESPIDDSAAPIFDELGGIFGVVLVFRDASQQRNAELALRQLAAIVESSEDAMISKTMDDVITSWNAAAERMFKFTAEEAIGKHVDIIIPEDRRDEHAETMRKVKAGERVNVFDTVRIRKDGSWFAASSAISPIKNSYGELIGTSHVLRDITERKQSEDSLAFLARASRTLAALIDRDSALQRAAGITVPFFADWCVVYCIDHEGNIERQACAHRDPAKGRLLREILDQYPLDWNSPAITVRVLRSGKTELIERMSETLLASTARNAAEQAAWKQLEPRSIICVPLLIRDRIVGAMTFVASTESRPYRPKDVDFAEDLASRVATAIDNAHLFNSMKHADRQKDEFLAMLAHELRNPLAAIQYATVLAQMPTGEAKSEVFEIIERQVRNLAHLIDDLLDVSRINQDKIQLKREFLDAATVVGRATAAVRPLIEQRRHTFTIDVAKEAMPLHADSTRAEQIVANLLTNAAKYTPNGGQIALRAYPENGFAVIKVKDTGVGLPPEMIPRVFDLFAQADRTLDRSEGGLGIGLTIVRKLAELHGGSVSAASEGLDQGSEFTVHLPLSTAGLDHGIATQEHTAQSNGSLRILVVDDNHDTANAAALWLNASGHDVRVAYDGRTAINVAREFRPQVLLLDIGLPELNGYEVAQSLRKEGFTKETFIAISGYGQAEDRKRSRQSGFNHHLIKPIDNKALISLLQGVKADDATTP